MLTAQRLRALADYNPETGVMTRRVSQTNRVRVGQKVGWVNLSDGYAYARMDCVPYSVHRLVWLYMTGEWPLEQIDHINCTRLDNRWGNLRAANNAQNQRNSSKSKRNTSGYKGVSRHGIRQRWRSRINYEGRERYLGLFDTREDAQAAYASAAKQFFGEFARAE